jgi:hypothetical protein
MTLERGLELLAGRRAWEAENGGVTVKGKEGILKRSRASKVGSIPTISRINQPRNAVKKNMSKKI